MKINYGLSDGAVLQRDAEGFCKCVFSAECSGELRSNIGNIQSLCDGQYLLSGIETGGRRCLVLCDDTDSISISVWVGDVWLLAGQSNMEGVARFSEADIYDEKNPDESIRAYYSDNHWGDAVPMLHEPWNSAYACQSVPWKTNHLNSPWKSDKPDFISHGVPKRGIGPGLFFAKRLHELSGGVPQAVIPCAYGGSRLRDWDSDGKENHYHAMIDRLKKIGGRVRGMFWYQGCAETNAHGIENFNSNMVKLIDNVRRECGDSSLPVVQVQIAKTATPVFAGSFEAGYNWMAIREKQRTLHTLIPFMDTITAIDSGYDDLIHLSGDSQKRVGERGALSMARLCGLGGEEAIRLKRMYITDDEYRITCTVLNIEYENASDLRSLGEASGFILTERSDEELLSPNMRIAKIEVEKSTVRLYTEYTKEELLEKYVSYCYLNMGYCNITDKNGHAIPAMGPLRIKEYV